MAKNNLEDLIPKINKEHGANAIMKLNDLDYDVERIPTGIASLDYILKGGLPMGKLALAWGVEGGGKSAIATMFAARAQQFGRVVYIDAENAFDPAKAENSGVDMDSLFISQPSSAEEILEIIEICLSADDVSAIIVDSVAAMTPEAEINGDYGDSHVGLLARLLSQGLRKINQYMIDNKSDTIIFFINQQREAIGGFSPGGGTPKTTPGGKALRYYSATTMEVARTDNIKQGENIIGQVSQVTLKKSKYAPPFQKAKFDILFDSGISNESTVLDLAVKKGLIDKTKQGYYTDATTGEKLGHGKPKVLAYFAENPDYAQQISDSVLKNP